MLLKGKRILYFAPSFFGYDELIAKKLIEMGAIVDQYDERPGNSFLIKSMLRIYPGAIESITKSYYKKVFSKIYGRQYDYVFIVNIEAMNEQILAELRLVCSEAIFVLYMWDSSYNKKGLSSYYHLFDHCFTFDRFDAENLPGMKFRPLFYIDNYSHLPIKKEKYQLSFVGTAHGDRSYILQKIKSQMSRVRLPFFYYLYLQSLKMFIYYKLTNPKFRSGLPLKEFSFKTLSQDQVVKIIASSKAVLDIQHEKQTGLTMRTLEVLGSGKKLITTNVDIVNYDFFHHDNILIINRDNPVIDMSFFNSPVAPLTSEIRNKYSIEGWITEIFTIGQLQAVPLST